MKKYSFLIALIVLTIVSATDVFGLDDRRTINKPKTQIFLEGGNDSWNTRRKPKNKSKAARKVKSKRASNTRKTNQQTNILPYIEQQNIKKNQVINGMGGSGNKKQSSRFRTRKRFANQETGYRKKKNRQ